MIRCGFCGYEFEDSDGIKGCGECGKPSGCSMVRCPRCFYENPEEPKILKKIKGMIKGAKR